jgi:adenosine tuberculosinyltransferase
MLPGAFINVFVRGWEAASYHMDSQQFQNLSPSAVAEIVREKGPRVCVFPINGTRRWFLLEYPQDDAEDYWESYMDIAARKHVELYGLFFEHGIETLLNPIFGPDILERGDDYMSMSAPGMAMMCTHPIFREFYEKHDVRVRFYGEHRRYFGPTKYAYLSDVFDKIADETRHHTKHRLYYGVCGSDATLSIAEFAIRHYLDKGCPPDKNAIIEMYYGEVLPPVNLFIGMDEFAAYDYPLLMTGHEDLYFMISPSSYLSGEQLRSILYDHLYVRQTDNEVDYATFSEADWQSMRAFYQANQGKTLGVGKLHPRLGYWYPLPEVQLDADHTAE